MEKIDRQPIAFFDFDGTITRKDSFLEFIKFAKGNNAYLAGMALLSPVLVLYKVGAMDNQRAKEIVLSYFFKGTPIDEMERIGADFALKRIPKIVRQSAMERIRFHQNNGHKIVMVTASIDLWVRRWCNKLGIDLLASRMEVVDGKVTGKLQGKNCHGEEKVCRIKEAFDLEQYGTVYTFGDTKGDHAMLELGDMKYYRFFKK